MNNEIRKKNINLKTFQSKKKSKKLRSNLIRKKNEGEWNHKKKLSQINQIVIKRMRIKYDRWKKSKEDEIEKRL